MITFIESKKNYIMALAILFVIVSLSGPTYSLFLKSDTTNTFNYNTGILDLEFQESEEIILDSVFPKNDSDGLMQEPYILTIKNTGTLTYKFDLKLDYLADLNTIDSRYIKVSINNSIPHTLAEINNIIATSLIIQPEEEMTFNIRLWLDKDTPNKELGKSFSAKVTSSGEAIYKTLDASGANHPKLENDMLAVYFDEATNTWYKADKSNLIEEYRWYNYESSMWANAVRIKESTKKIYDINNSNDLVIDNLTVNNNNLIIDNNSFNINLNNNFSSITSVLRVKINDIKQDNIYFISSDNMSFYYDNTTKKFIYTNGYIYYSSNEYELTEDTWYTITYSFDGSLIKIYIDGTLLSSGTLNSNIASYFKIGTDINNTHVSNLTISDIYFYDTVLSDEIILNNYNKEINIIYDNLISGYNEFTPMTLYEYYSSRENGTFVDISDIVGFYVWIPRFKYQVWNVTGEEGIDSYNATSSGINIVFERNLAKTGNIYCHDEVCYSDETNETITTQADNGKYYTHPAFSTASEDISGFWVSKYELSLKDGSVIESMPNTSPWVNNSLANFYQEIKKINNNYSVIKNTEWGAIAYLSHSKYGLCKNGTCNKILANNTYTSGYNEKDSTTGNITGVYDMAGSKIEFTMANTTFVRNQLSLNNSSFLNIPISNNDYDLYYDNAFILGDATKELLSNDSLYIDEDGNWLARGGIANSNQSTIYDSYRVSDIANENITTRMVIR